MVTFTFPHTFFDHPGQLLTKQSSAFRLLRAGREWQSEKGEIGFVGLIRALELTVGNNGWHPHTHELWIVNEDCNVDLLLSKVMKRWESACIKTGLLTSDKIEDFRNYAVDMKDNAQNSEYFAKFNNRSAWGIDREIAKASTKKSTGCHPFELLTEYCGNLPYSKETRWEMFVEYATVMRGKKQIYWSQGLKKTVGLDEKTDEELASEDVEIALLLGRLSPEQWKIIVREVAESEILYRAETGGWIQVQEWFYKRE
jgi:hypothetical protein